MKKKVYWTLLVKLLTAIVFTALIAGDILFFLEITKPDTGYLAFDIFLITIMTASIVISWGYAPLSITLSDTHFMLRRGIGNKKIEYSQIVEISVYKEKGYTIRVFGSGGLCGFIGRFYNKNFGYYFAYVGDFSQAFSIQLKNGKKYVFSCEDRDEVISYISSKT